MSRTVGNGSKAVPPTLQKTWLDSMPSTQRVSGKNQKRGAQPQETFEEEQRRQYAEQREIWAREGIFWCKITGTFESRRDGQPSKPVSGHWFHNKEKGLIEMYEDLRQPPVQTREVVFFKKRPKGSGALNQLHETSSSYL
jgi:hypothetical protein